MRDFITTRIRSFGHAFAGWAYVLRTQRNTWIHALFTIAAFLAGFWLGLDRVEWGLIIVAIILVWLAEFLNTALEAIVDLASPQQHPLAKVGKDVGAAAVLITALAAVLIGLLVLGPPFWVRLVSIFS